MYILCPFISALFLHPSKMVCLLWWLTTVFLQRIAFFKGNSMSETVWKYTTDIVRKNSACSRIIHDSSGNVRHPITTSECCSSSADYLFEIPSFRSPFCLWDWTTKNDNAPNQALQPSLISLQSPQSKILSFQAINASKTIANAILLMLVACKIDVRNFWFFHEF